METKNENIWTQLNEILNTHEVIMSPREKKPLERLDEFIKTLIENVEQGSCKTCKFCIPFDSYSRQEFIEHFMSDRGKANRFDEMAAYYCAFNDVGRWYTEEALENYQFIDRPEYYDEYVTNITKACVFYESASLLYKLSDDEMGDAKSRKWKLLSCLGNALSYKNRIIELMSGSVHQNLERCVIRLETGNYGDDGELNPEDLPF